MGHILYFIGVGVVLNNKCILHCFVVWNFSISWSMLNWAYTYDIHMESPSHREAMGRLPLYQITVKGASLCVAFSWKQRSGQITNMTCSSFFLTNSSQSLLVVFSYSMLLTLQRNLFSQFNCGSTKYYWSEKGGKCHQSFS